MSNRLAVLAADIRKAHEDVCKYAGHSAERAVDAGRALYEAKDDETMLRGGWAKWVEQESGVPYRTAQRYIQLFVATQDGSVTLQDIAEAGQIGALKEVRAAEKKDARTEKESALALATIAASERLGRKVYGVIYADPCWRFEPYSRDTGMDRAADNHYPTLPTDQIAAINVPAAADCVLFLWATAPMLLDALRVMEAWGFTYKTNIVWVKDRIGTGYWARSQHELLLIGTKGHIPAPSHGDQPPSVIKAAVTKHSAKPNHFAELIEEMFPNLPALEMFARQPRLGWDVWGNEVEEMNEQ